MTVPAADLVVSFRDLGEPRPLAARLIATAHRHPHGWTVHTTDGTRLESLTFDAAAEGVASVTGCCRLLIVWPGR